MAWIEEVMANDWQQPVVPIAPREAAHVIVCDASAWGWGAQHLDRHTGSVCLVSRKWPDGYPGAKTSTWAESDGVAKALQHFFADGPPAGLLVLTDSSAAAGAFTKGRSTSFPVNRAINEVQTRGFDTARILFRHVPGVDNPADPLSRNVAMEDTSDEAAARIERLVVGLPLPGGVPSLA
eukprot:PhM_4_TR14692/c1_g2_i1/m.68303